MEADWTGLLPPASTNPAHPRVAPSSCHNRRNCTRTQAQRFVPLRKHGGSSPDSGFCRCVGRVVEGGWAVNEDCGGGGWVGESLGI